MFALINCFTLTSKNITVWWQNKSSGLVIFKKRNGIFSNFFFFLNHHIIEQLLNEAVQHKSKTTFCASLAMAWEMQGLNLIQYFSSYLDPSVCPRIHAFFLSTISIFNKSSLIQFYTLFLICVKSVNKFWSSFFIC